LSKKRKSLFTDGPQVKIMKEQVTAVHEQVDVFKQIERHLNDLKLIEAEKLNVMKGRAS
jgi:hypothetical protein